MFQCCEEKVAELFSAILAIGVRITWKAYNEASK